MECPFPLHRHTCRPRGGSGCLLATMCAAELHVVPISEREWPSVLCISIKNNKRHRGPGKTTPCVRTVVVRGIEWDAVLEWLVNWKEMDVDGVTWLVEFKAKTPAFRTLPSRVQWSPACFFGDQPAGVTTFALRRTCPSQGGPALKHSLLHGIFYCIWNHHLLNDHHK